MSKTDHLMSQANARYVAGDLTGCADLCEEILETDTNHAGANHLTGRLAQRAGNNELAVEYFGRAAATEPTETRHPFAQAAALRQLDRNSEAIKSLKTALVLNPEFHAAHFNLANALKDEGDFLAALPHYKTATDLLPNNVDYLANLAACHRELEEMGQALAAIDRAIAAKPDAFNLAWDRAQMLLMAENFQDGWDAYPSRFEIGPTAFRRRHQDRPEWDGHPIASGKLLLWGDQGIGDEMIVGSLISEAQALAPEIILECEPRLVPLFDRSLPNVEVVARGDPPDDRLMDIAIVAQLPTGDLPRLLRRQRESFVPNPGYLRADTDAIAEVASRLPAEIDSQQVGISWESANPFYKQRVDVPLTLWDEVLSVEGIQFTSVQYGDHKETLAAASERTGITIHWDPEIDLWSDIDGAAALLLNLDLVIAVSNSTACLAGALGVPVWQLLPTAPEFYWGLSNEDTLWFQSMRLKRQTSAGDWEELMVRLADDLTGWHDTR